MRNIFYASCNVIITLKRIFISKRIVQTIPFRVNLDNILIQINTPTLWESILETTLFTSICKDKNKKQLAAVQKKVNWWLAK